MTRLLLLAALLGTAGCRSILDGERPDPRVCPQTYEFGNYGCARVVALVEGPPAPWPPSHRFDVRGVPARSNTGASTALAPNPGVGAIPLQLTLWGRPPAGAGDTASVWIVAKLLDDPRPAVTGVPLPVFAADSVLHVVRFAPVGSAPRVDTVRLTLRRP